MSMFKKVAGKARKIEMTEAEKLILDEEQEEMRKKAHAKTTSVGTDHRPAKRKP